MLRAWFKRVIYLGYLYKRNFFFGLNGLSVFSLGFLDEYRKMFRAWFKQEIYLGYLYKRNFF